MGGRQFDIRVNRGSIDMHYYDIKDGAMLLPQSVTRRLEKDHADVMGDELRRVYHSGRAKEDQEGSVYLHTLNDDQLVVLRDVATSTNNKRLANIADAIIRFDEAPVPSFEAFHAMLLRWLRKNAPNGWLYTVHDNGNVYPRAVLDVRRYDPYSRDRDDKPRVMLSMGYTTAMKDLHRHETYHSSDITFEPGMVTRKRIGKILDNAGLLLETSELRQSYDEGLQHLREEVYGQYSKQFRCDRTDTVPGAKVLMLTCDEDMDIAMDSEAISRVMLGEDGEPGAEVHLPVHPVVRTFDLSTQIMRSAHARSLTRYAYDPSLADKLILPESHMDILDILTTDTDVLMGDIIEGKSAGNIILCKGIPGIGKTLTAEVYSELVEKPIYSVHSGSLGTSPDEVERSLRTIFQRVKDWDCLLLLDEADVFVKERGADLIQNAIVAVFLRTLEYFDGLMFMTTNRSDDIDDAIISRCAAIIDYGIPTRSDAFAIWRVLSEQNGLEFSDELVTAAIDAFPKATPRDVKQLIRLAGRVALRDNTEVTEELLRRVAQFRNVYIAPKEDAARAKGTPTTRRRRRPVKAA